MEDKLLRATTPQFGFGWHLLMHENEIVDLSMIEGPLVCRFLDTIYRSSLIFSSKL